MPGVRLERCGIQLNELLGRDYRGNAVTTTITCTCPQCSKQFAAVTGRWNRAQKIGAPIYCGKVCSGLARRLANPPTETERAAAKAEYDRNYRTKNADSRKAQKAAYFKRTYNPEQAAVERKGRAHMHAEYCRRPEYKAWKRDYDKRFLAKKNFGEFAEAALILRGIEQEIDARMTRYEIYQTNGTLNKAQTRRRAL